MPSFGITLANLDQGIEVERRNRRTLNDRCNAPDHNILNLVLVEELKNLAKAGIHQWNAVSERS